MRQPHKPFSVEIRHAARRKPSSNGAPLPSFAGTVAKRQDDHDAVLRAADALFGAVGDWDDPPQPQAAPSGQEPTRSAAKPVGRILQAIEDPPVHVDVPAEIQSPRRRGRPPGSKNKVQRQPHPVECAERQDAAILNAEQLVASLFGSVEDEPAAVPADPAPRAASRPAGPVGRLRYSWIRKDLGPGERWKRRMSRVCW